MSENSDDNLAVVVSKLKVFQNTPGLALFNCYGFVKADELIKSDGISPVFRMMLIELQTLLTAYLTSNTFTQLDMKRVALLEAAGYSSHHFPAYPGKFVMPRSPETVHVSVLIDTPVGQLQFFL